MAARPAPVPFGTWLKNKLLLNHVVMHTNPFIYLAKCAIVIAVVLLFDQRVTKQPDSVTSLFTALLCLGPTVLLGSKAGMDIFIASMIGTAWGSLCTVIFHVHGDNVLHFDSYFLLHRVTDDAGNLECITANPHCGTYLWLLLARVPLGVCCTIYTLMVIRRSDPGSMATGARRASCKRELIFHQVSSLHSTCSCSRSTGPTHCAIPIPTFGWRGTSSQRLSSALWPPSPVSLLQPS